MKWILSLAAVAAFVAFAIYQRGAVKTSYVNGLAVYSRLPGQEFILERDCYVFKLKKHDTSWPLVGANFQGSSVTIPGLPSEISEKNVGQDSPEVRILDIVRSGARFKIVSVRRDESRAGTTISFEILLLDEAERKYPRLDAFWIMDHSPEKNGAAPTMIEDFAVPGRRK